MEKFNQMKKITKIIKEKENIKNRMIFNGTFVTLISQLRMWECIFEKQKIIFKSCTH